MLPQRQTTDGSSETWMWPTSPALPCAPRCSRPSEMIPAPIPVPTLITTTLSWPAATPDRHSPERQQVDVVVDPDGGLVSGREPLADRVAVPARHDRRRDRPTRAELDGARDADADPPEPTRDVLGVRSRRSNSASTRSSSASGPSSIRAGSSWWPRIRPSSVVIATSMLVAPRSATRTWPAVARKSSCRGGRPPVVGPTEPSATRPRSIELPDACGRRSRDPSPVRCTSSERDRDRPSRISSRTMTRSSSTSSGRGEGVSGSGWSTRRDDRASAAREDDFCT